MSTPSEPSNRKKPTPLHWTGSLLLMLGATLCVVFIMRQMKESGSGHTYYEFIGGGAALAILGIIIIAVARRKSP
jgi:hypothetical protein